MSQVPPYLAKWVQDRLDSYKEKPRAGIPRGQPHGVPKHKYHAVLLHLAHNKSFDLRAIAQHAGVSYGLLLKWRTEERFKQLTLQAAAEYSRKLIDSVVLGESDSGLYGMFTKQELPRYSLLLHYRILDDLFAAYKSELEKIQQSNQMLMDKWKSLSRVHRFFFSVVEVGVNAWAKPDRKIAFYEGRAKRSSQFLKLVGKAYRFALKKGMKGDTQEIFDTVVTIAEEAIVETTSLRKELIRRGMNKKDAGRT